MIADLYGYLAQSGQFELLHERGNEIYARCPFPERHRGNVDLHPSWRINTETGYWYCLTGETSVMTWNGYVSIRELSGTTAPILTMGRTSSRWVEAPFKSFMNQKVLRVRLRRNGVSKTIRATKFHRWFVRTGSEKWAETITEQLRPGQRLRSIVPPRSGTIKPSPWGVARGFAYGDGERLGKYGVRVCLWGDKDAAMEKYYPLSNKRYITKKHLRGMQIDGLPRFFKELPDVEETPSYLYGWLAGYFAADGCVSKEGMPTLASASKKSLEFVRRFCIRLGIVTYGIKKQQRVGLGQKASWLYSLSFSRKSLNHSFFLLKHHLERWESNRTVRERAGWVVEAVEDHNETEEVFCATVPETHSFVLEGNILTGNCFSCKKGGILDELVEELDLPRILGMSAPDEFRKRMAKVRQRMGGKETKTPHWPLPDDFTLFKKDDSHPSAHYLFGDLGINWASVVAFGIGYSSQRGDIIYPIPDENGRQIAWQRRLLPPSDSAVPYIFPDKFDKSLFLYNIHRVKRGDSVAIVEGIKAVIILHQWGIPAVSSLNAFVSVGQLRYMARLSEVTALLDGDEAGIQGTDSFEALLHAHPLAGRVWKASLPNRGKKSSPDDFPQEVVQKCLADRQRIDLEGTPTESEIRKKLDFLASD